ncbi:hypothetical protein IW140_005399 [Coemansia sp. RSA 1813]|nr:hypothetical protein EV178_005482 [Coemansia sp. RSA 1646]KAJ1769018.1 hypothetical protein LPJ74_004382 [Coemansia sp. RSA 1843]KAJ2086646.1 hypothetical protein IW138_005517 [Coemansia sp. RSA 986]KAJ2211435.1 hypothetical protein EV179_005477 [Coemansia sp. RSA 487]KAJ2565286.1 hypothetical protein IW140_005399 [Coemansia sp. RSA 1813]
MITPKFSVRQDETSVYVTIHASHVRAQSIEFDVDGDQFKFFASPYYLRLTFPGNILEDDKSTASFDAATGDILVTLSKEKSGEHFENLDLLTGLLATRREREHGMAGGDNAGGTKRPIIEEIDGPLGPEVREELRMDEDFDWEIPQTVCTNMEHDEILVKGAKYGFDQQYSGIFTHVQETANEINELPSPEAMTAEERRNSRIASENAKFDEDYYMENYMYDDDIVPSIRFKTRHYHILKQQQRSQKVAAEKSESNSSVEKLAHDMQQNLTTDTSEKNAKGYGAGHEEFTDDERKTMLDLPRKTYLISQKQPVYLGLVDILFAYSLDYRANMGEHTVETAWAIGAVSSLFSNLERFSTLRDVIIASFRRGLAYPLYRNWELCEKALEDVYVILKLGRRAILKTMLEIKGLFDHHDVYYIYSKIFIDDYCVWLQTAASEKALQSLAHQVHSIEIDKEETGWPLNEYEDLALQTSESESENGEIANDIRHLGPDNEDFDPENIELAQKTVLFPSSASKKDGSKKPLIQEIGGNEE